VAQLDRSGICFFRIPTAACIAALVICVIASGRAIAEIPNRNPEKLSPEELTSRLDFSPRMVYYGGLMVDAGDTATGPLIVMNGALDIQDGGVVSGNAWVINGTLILNGSAVLEGDANLVNSIEYLSHAGRIGGLIHRYSCECRLDDELFEREKKLAFVRERAPRAVTVKRAISIGTANRTDYNVVNLGFARENRLHREPYVRGRAMLHVPIWKKSHGFLGFSADIAVPLGGETFELLLQGFKTTWTEDDWQLSRAENAFIVALTGDDFADYYEKRGGGAGVRFHVSEELTVESMLLFQRDLSLEAQSIPSILRTTDSYRANPSIDEGQRLRSTCRIALDTRDDVYRPADAWFLVLACDRGIADGPGDFSYTAFEIDVCRYEKLVGGLRLDLRGTLVSAFDPVPLQMTRWVHGYGGIRGADDDPFPVHRGNRMAVLSAELRKQMPDVALLRRLFSRWSAFLFSDVGLLMAETHERRPFDFLERPFDEWRKTVGAGLSAESFVPYLGLYIAQDLDRNAFEPRFIIRAQRSF
jgi:hypothetical protein